MATFNKTGDISIVNGKAQIIYKLQSPKQNLPAKIACGISAPVNWTGSSDVELRTMGIISGEGSLNGIIPPSNPILPPLDPKGVYDEGYIGDARAVLSGKLVLGSGIDWQQRLNNQVVFTASDSRFGLLNTSLSVGYRVWDRWNAKYYHPNLITTYFDRAVGNRLTCGFSVSQDSNNDGDHLRITITGRPGTRWAGIVLLETIIFINAIGNKY